MVLGEGGERINDLVFTFLLSSMHVIIPILQWRRSESLAVPSKWELKGKRSTFSGMNIRLTAYYSFLNLLVLSFLIVAANDYLDDGD